MAAMAALRSSEQLVRSLPIRLQKFFALYPPGSVAPSLQEIKTAIPDEQPGPPTQTRAVKLKLNPFQPHKNLATGRWHPPIYSLRRQADLVKLAAAHGVEELLPYTVKKTEERAQRRIERGLRVKGTGVGDKVKGHFWERTLKSRQEKRRQAMLEMPKMIQQWKQRGHGRGWTKWPR